MRHFIAARPVTTRSLGMGEPPWAAGLVAPSGGILLASPRSLRAVSGAVDLAAVATAADHSLGTTIRTKKQPSRRSVTVFGPADAKWTNATIARIMALHACPARCGARRRGETAKLGSAPCLPSITSKLLSRHPVFFAFSQILARLSVSGLSWHRRLWRREVDGVTTLLAGPEMIPPLARVGKR